MFRDFGVHNLTEHGELKRLMQRDSRAGISDILARLYPTAQEIERRREKEVRNLVRLKEEVVVKKEPAVLEEQSETSKKVKVKAEAVEPVDFELEESCNEEDVDNPAENPISVESPPARPPTPSPAPPRVPKAPAAAPKEVAGNVEVGEKEVPESRLVENNKEKVSSRIVAARQDTVHPVLEKDKTLKRVEVARKDSQVVEKRKNNRDKKGARPQLMMEKNKESRKEETTKQHQPMAGTSKKNNQDKRLEVVTKSPEQVAAKKKNNKEMVTKWPQQEKNKKKNNEEVVTKVPEQVAEKNKSKEEAVTKVPQQMEVNSTVEPQQEVRRLPPSQEVARPIVDRVSKDQEIMKEIMMKLTQVHNCVLCNDRDGRSMNLGSGLWDIKYHYAVSVAITKNFHFHISFEENSH